MNRNLLIVLVIISFSLSSFSATAQLNPDRFNPASSLQSTLNLELLIFSDGSTLLNGESDVDPNLPVQYNDGIISGLTNDFTSKQKGIWTFSLMTEDIFGEVNAKVVLPERAKLVTGSISSNSFPLVYTQGNSLVVEVSDIQKSLELSFDYELPAKADESGSNEIFLIYLFAAIISLAIVFLILRNRKKKPVKNKKRKKSKPKREQLTGIDGFKKKFETVRQTLSDREISIIEGLIELKGSAKQNQLQKFTGISKAAFSRHISALEAKGLIEKRSLGRVNRIQLKLE